MAETRKSDKIPLFSLQNLIEQILRAKIYQSRYWKEECFGLNAETLVDQAVQLNHVGGTYGGQRKPADFMCLICKMLQIQPDKEIVVEFIKNEEYKYVRLLGNAKIWDVQGRSEYVICLIRIIVTRSASSSLLHLMRVSS